MVSPARAGSSGVLAATVVEIERHVARSGWDRPPVLFALVDTADLARREPALARSLGLADAAATAGSLTPIEQEPLGQAPLDEALAGIAWPPDVLGCALAHEVLVLPPAAERAGRPADAVDWAAGHPDRREVRMVVGVLRDGSRASVLRVRAGGAPVGPEARSPGAGAGADDDVLVGADLAPNLADALLETFSPY